MIIASKTKVCVGRYPLGDYLPLESHCYDCNAKIQWKKERVNHLEQRRERKILLMTSVLHIQPWYMEDRNQTWSGRGRIHFTRLSSVRNRGSPLIPDQIHSNSPCSSKVWLFTSPSTCEPTGDAKGWTWAIPAGQACALPLYDSCIRRGDNEESGKAPDRW